ncbi:hypothetical protein NDU88_008125 [Pleurodeles waltl]|uniref:Uncharacterized protein n=1 Tax=Pleurodeles waltl TaxID=8319 RepID=A0AAV7VVR5_PLEWA|nr:hypothetical protein NDU88_008125 [Pleurodeles waltl]
MAEGPTAVRPADALPSPSLPLTSLCYRQRLKKRPGVNPTPNLGPALRRENASVARKSAIGLRGGAR